MDMDSTNTISKSSLLVTGDQDRLAAIRKRNRNLILIVFSIIMSVALITGGIIIYLVRIQYLEVHQSNLQNSAIRHFCSASQSDYFNCIVSLSHFAKTTPFVNPNQIFLLSLKKTYNELSDILATRPETCSSSLSHALSHINSSLVVIWVNLDLEMLTNEEMRGVKAGMETAMENLGSCVNVTRKDNSTAEEEVSMKVYDILVWMRYSNDFLHRYSMINENFRSRSVNDGESGRVVENFLEVSLFGSQYLVLVLLFCVFFRM